MLLHKKAEREFDMEDQVAVAKVLKAKFNNLDAITLIQLTADILEALCPEIK